MRFLPLLLALGTTACAAPAPRSAPEPDAVAPSAPPESESPAEPTPAEPWLAPGWHGARSDDDLALFAWRPVAGALPKNRHFDLEVWVVRDGVPVSDAELVVRATMPEHGHGMNVEPRAFAQPDGSYRVRGLLFHMGGRWELTLDSLEPAHHHRARFELEVR